MDRDYRVKIKRTKPSESYNVWFEEIVFRVSAASNKGAAEMAESVLENHHIWISDGLEMTVELVEKEGGR